MARTTLTPTVLTAGGYPTAGVVASLEAADASNFNDFVSTGKEILIAYNSDVGAQTVTIASTADPYSRIRDITTESIAAGAMHTFGPFAKPYWAQTNGNINVTASSALVLLAVLK